MNLRRVILMAAGLCMLASRAFAFDPLFNVRIDYGVGSFPISVCAADLDGDGHIDLAVANYYSSNISILKNKGDGTFEAAVSYGVGSWPVSICAADLDGDHHIDLAVANYNSANVSILRNKGDGTGDMTIDFWPAVNHDVGSYPRSVCAADLDRDGHIDLAVANYDSDNVSILRNKGDGTIDFWPAVNYEVGNGPMSVCAADLDGDGYSDLAVANRSSSNVSILRNKGDGTGDGTIDFWPAVNVVAGDGPISVCAADLDGDDHMDLTVANEYSDNVSILRNKGNGTIDFWPVVDYGVGSPLGFVCAADLDRDGHVDLAVANYNSDNVSILRNRGNGTFEAAVNYVVGGPSSVCAADLDGDGDNDLAVPNYGSPSLYVNGSISILRNNGDGTFAVAANYGVDSGPMSVCAADLDGDGYSDLAVANYSSNNVSILRNNRDGTFAAAVNYSVGSGPISVCAADLDRDGHIDLAVANYDSDNISILKNNGNGIFVLDGNYDVGSGPRFVCAADLDGDDYSDLAVANYSSNNVSILKNNRDGTFELDRNCDTGNEPYSVCAADFDGDGYNDLAVTSVTSDNVSILKNNRDWAFAVAGNYDVGDSPVSVCAVDLDGDGHSDLAVANYQSDNVSILRNKGDGTFAFEPAVNYGVGPYPRSVCATDLDGDGDSDLAVANSYSDDVLILKNNGDGTFALDMYYGVAIQPQSVCAADLDRDGYSDLATANFYSNNVSILVNIREVVVATLLQRYITSLRGSSICVSWTLSAIDEDARFSMLRAQAPRWNFEKLEDASIEQDGLSFTFIDGATLPGVNYKYRVDYEAEGNPPKTLFQSEAMATPALSATLYQNCPNPFNPSTLIRYYVPERSRVAVEIYDVSGKRIVQLVRKEHEKGFYVVQWNGIDDRGNVAASGVYFCRLAAGKERISKKIILLR